MKKTSSIRVRFAPSPTGDPHIGSIWTALFNWIFAKQHQGQFILRLEDTDQKRLVSGAAEKIFEALEWYGLQPDEGPNVGGDFGPYTQSQRLDLYRPYVKQLLQQGSAYYCFCTAERLEKLRHDQQAQKQPPRYDKHCATISYEQAKTRAGRGETAVVRLRVPTEGQIEHSDLIRGKVVFRADQIDDTVLLKSDGYPTYHLANVVDDHLMKISHVIRAEEWLPSTPKHLLLYQALQWQPPVFAHLPLLLGMDGSKLSKRHGSISALSFRDQGYLPDAMINFLALMGWHPKGDREIISRPEIIKKFKMEEINPSGAKFDQRKLDWLNGWYLRQLPPDELRRLVRPFFQWPLTNPQDQRYFERSIKLVQERLHRLSDISALVGFVLPAVWDQEREAFETQLLVPKKGALGQTAQNLKWAAGWLEAYSGPWEAAQLKSGLLKAIQGHSKTNLGVLWPLRVALTLRGASPDVFDILELLGRQESMRRINACTRKLRMGD